MGMAISGLTSDARVLYKYMKRETNNHKNQFNIPVPSGKLMDKLALKFQSKTYTSGSRPYGVGLLIAYYDGEEAHLYEITPAGELFEYYVGEIVTQGIFFGPESSVCKNLLREQPGKVRRW